MMRKLFLFSLLLVSVSRPAVTHAGTATVNDEAGLFAIGQIHSLGQQAERLSEKIRGRILIATTTSNPEEPRDFADNYLKKAVGSDQNDSVLLLGIGRREIYISTSGNMIDYLTDSRIDSILDDVYDQMTNVAYYDATKAYLSKSATYVEDGVPEGHYRVDRETDKITHYKVLATVEIIIAVVLALILSLVFYFVTISCYQLGSGIYKYPFRKKPNIRLTEKADRLTSSSVTIRKTPKSPPPGNSDGGGTAYSSGGGTFGGGGESF